MPPMSPIPILGHLVIMGKQMKLPSKADYKKAPNKKHYDQAIAKKDKAAAPKEILPFFFPQEQGLKLHQETCDDVGKKWKEFHDTMVDAVKFSLDMWRLQAKIKDLKVMAVCAIGTPGCLDGPSLESNIKNFPKCAAWTDNAAKLRDAVAKGVAKCFENWQKQVMVPGFPWYPAFAAFPSASAPPMPNIPMPLIACVSSKVADIITPNTMKDEMIKALSGPPKDDDHDKQHEVIFEGIATVLSLGFLMWLASQQVMLVMGKGPIPIFAPPYVPVGPVLAGDNIAAPGHLIA